MDDYAHGTYRITRSFPKEEMDGITSQLRRSALSVVLNYIKDYARKSPGSHKHFLEMSYESLQESKYLLHFSLVEESITEKECSATLKLADQIGAMP